LGCRKEGRAGGVHGARAFEQFAQAEPGQRFLAASADEFAANPMPRVVTGFPHGHRHAVLTQPDAEGQPGQPAADNGDGFRGHVFNPYGGRRISG
jgi:hypothetical protein